VEGEVLELVYLAGSWIVEKFRKYAVLRLKTPRETEEVVSDISGLTKADARGRVVAACGDYSSTLGNCGGGSPRGEEVLEQICDPGGGLSTSCGASV